MNNLLLVSFCLILYGCSSLPRYMPDMASTKRPAIQIANANGLISKEESKAMLATMRNRIRFRQTNIFDYHLANEQAIVGGPLSAGNSAKILIDGPQTYAAMLEAIATASDHINLETYIFDDDLIGQEFVAALINKQRQGVQVNMIRDSVGTLNTPTEIFEKLKSAGVMLLEFNPVNPLLARNQWELNRRDHRKLLIIDGRIAFLGGINISSVYSGGSSTKDNIEGRIAWRDTHLQLNGPVVAELQKLFFSTWDKQKGDAVAAKDYFPALVSQGNQMIRVIGSAPEEPFSQIYATLLSAIENAETSIQLTNGYFAPDPQLIFGLIEAAKRGVSVSLILPSQTDSWLVFHAGRAYYTQLLEGGVKIFQRRGVILHSKTAVIDGVWSTVGSTNLDWRSFLHNQELNAVMIGADFGFQVQSMFEKDLQESVEIKLDQWKNRSFDQRVKELFAQMWEYWL